jgi:site-specific recombinase XerD
MKEHEEPLAMMELLFGAPAQAAQREAPERMLRWRQAFQDWLEERKRRYKRDTLKQSKTAWKRLAQQCRKTPWEMTAQDFEEHAEWMEKEGYSPATISCALGIFANFYRWCEERRVDPECEARFNPAEKARRPQVGRYRGAELLSREEMERLLRMIQRDSSELGRRDYAFILLRLRSGAPLGYLQQLKWGQIEQDGEGTWVRWRAEGERQRLDAEAWEAMRKALEASGRLEGMRAGDYIFAPLAEPGREGKGSKAEDWRGSKPLTAGQLLLNLKLYGRLAGIEEKKLTLMALRRTAMRLRLDEGASVEEMQAFLDCQEEAKFTKCRLAKLPKLPADEERRGKGSEREERRPDRRAKPFKPGEGTKHGFYAKSQPSEAVKQILKESIEDIEEQIVGMRILERKLVEKQEQAKNRQEAAMLIEACSLAAFSTGELIKAEKELVGKNKDSKWKEDFLAGLSRVSIWMGKGPVTEEMLLKEARGGKPGTDTTSRRTEEEIGTMRYLMRNVHKWACETEDTGELVRMVGLYSTGCGKLVKLLKMEKGSGEQLVTYVNELIENALKEAAKTLGLEKL